MTRLLEDLFIGSPHDLAIQTDTETFLEQETTGLRVKSAVELNNPLIYGSDVGRIMLRSTPSVELMKDARIPEGVESSTSGLLGKGLAKLTGGKIKTVSGVRNKINDFLGIPSALIPTRVWNKMDENPQLSVQDILDQKNGTEFGKFLKQTGGGTPKTIVNQLIGNTITLGKDKLRDTLFGKPLTINDIAGVKTGDNTNYRFDNTYTKVQTEIGYTNAKSKDDIFNEIADKQLNAGHELINLKAISPIYGVDRKSYLYNSKLGKRIVKNGNGINNWGLSPYSSDNRYVNYADKSNQSPISKKSLENKYGLSHLSDDLNMAGGKNETRTTEELEGLDLIPFWIGKVDNPQKTHFRTILTGITETVSPSWNSNNFFGNPFQFYTYSSIERNVSFSLQIYCSNITELLRNWEKVNTLTEYTYPTIKPTDDGRYAEPPIINFRIGHIYNKKVGFIESLSYTYPDGGTWEIDPEIGLLPKFIEVSITIKFIEDYSISETKEFYDYLKSDEATAYANEKSGASNFSTDPALSSNGKRNARGLAPLNPSPPKMITSITGIKSPTPHTTHNQTDSTNTSDANIPNVTPDKSSNELMNESQSTLQLTREQSELWIGSLQPSGFKQEKNTNGISTSAGDIAYSHPDLSYILIVHPNGSTSKGTSPPSITNKINSIDSIL